MIKFLNNIFILFIVAFLANTSTYAQKKKKDSVIVNKDSIILKYNFKKNQTGGLFLDYLANKEIIFDKDLNIDTLENRIKSVSEMIIATNGTVEGEMTAKYLKSLFESESLSITRLASGLPVGAELKYADELTLSKAVENRRKY